jgi:hypothetical protein
MAERESYHPPFANYSFRWALTQAGRDSTQEQNPAAEFIKFLAGMIKRDALARSIYHLRWENGYRRRHRLDRVMTKVEWIVS